MFVLYVASSLPPAYEGEPSAEHLAAAECARADRRVAMLDEVAELAMELARANQRKALEQLEAPADEAEVVAPARGRDPMTGFMNAARAVRLTLMLQARLQAGLNARRGELRAERKSRLLEEGIEVAREHSRKSDLADVVAEVIKLEAGDRADVETLAKAGRREVRDGWDDADFDEKAVSAVVAEVCESLGVKVNWKLWAGEDWALEEVDDEVEGSPFVTMDDELEQAAGTARPFGAPDAEAHATGPP